MSRRLCIIDTDPGVDDSMAILLALSSPKLDVLGLTICHGNLGGEEGIQQLARNAVRLLCLTKQYHVPVIRGEWKPLDRPAHTGAPFVHGTDGQGDIEGYHVLPEDAEKVKVLDDAPQWIVDTILAPRPEDSEPIIIFSLGPMSNLGKALRINPEIANPKKAVLYTMGGCFWVHGNISPNSEANIFNDPEAADLCFRHFETNLSPLDFTTKIRLTVPYLSELSTSSPFFGEFIRRISLPYLEFHKKHENIEHSPVHDSSAIGAFLWPEVYVDTRHTWVRVECTDGFCRGVTVGDFRNTTQNVVVREDIKKNVRVNFNVNHEEFLRLFKEAITSLEHLVKN